MQRHGDWMQTFTGRQFWPLDPRADEIHIEDIAHSLSLQCRFAGHVREFYSVAEHSWRVSQICNPGHALPGLLHDAAEAYLVDLPRPIKHFSTLGNEYRKIENYLMTCIATRFNLGAPPPLDIKVSDDFMLRWEQRDLMAPPPAPWRETGGTLPDERIEPMTSRAAEMAFLQRFAELSENGG
jgi:hypothetical protein